MKLLQCYIDNIIKTALMEDINYIDAAADNLIPADHKSSAYYVAKDTGVVCGIEVAKRVFELVGEDVEFNILLGDGSKVRKGDIIAELKGSTLTLLKGERTALNILQHMSGIATATNKCVEAVAQMLLSQIQEKLFPDFVPCKNTLLQSEEAKITDSTSPMQLC